MPAELGADRAARAGDHHHAVAEPFAQARVVENDRIASQEVVELDRADRGQRRAPAHQVLVRRHGEHFDSRIGADLRDAAAHAVRGRRQRDDHLAHAVLLRPRRQARDRTQHAHAVQQPPALRRIVVDEPDHAPLPAPRELAREARAGFARADHEHRLAERGERAVEPVLLPDPVGEAIAGHQEDEHDRVEDQHAARHDRLHLQHHEDRPGSAARRARRRARSAAGRGRSRIATGRDRGRRRRRSRACSGRIQTSVRAMSARNGSRKSRPNRSQYIEAQASAATQRSWTKASHARKFWGCFIVVLMYACANDSQCRQRARRSRRSTLRAPASPRPARRPA